MYVLALDTSLQRASVAITRNGEAIAVEVEDIERGHAERLAPMVAGALEKAGLAPLDLDRVGVVVGPGGFTGVRVALSFARAFALASAAEIVGVTSLAAIAAGPGDGLVAGLIDARRGEVYAALYQNGAEIISPFVAEPSDAVERLTAAAGASPVIATGSGVACIAMPAAWRAAGLDPQIDPLCVARLAARAPAPSGPPAPVYLRAPNAKPPSAKLKP